MLSQSPQIMKSFSISTLSFSLLLIFSCSWTASARGHSYFLECLYSHSQNYSSISNLVYTFANSSYTTILQSEIRNQRFASDSTPKPQVIITPDHESQIPAVILCARRSGLEIRTRSGGHDIEGLSYVSRLPFVVLDLFHLSEVTVNVEKKTAWVGGGANLGSLYYRIGEKSKVLGFPAGVCPTVGVGGHISGGGYSTMLRKYGLAADHVIDARIVDVNGRILNRKSMGKDLFWAIRGGGGASFGVIVAWKLRLVDVPETVTVFTVVRTLDQNATQLLHRWQYVAPQLDRDLFIGFMIRRNSSQGGVTNPRIEVLFWSLYLGGVDKFLPILGESFPELGVVRNDCTEMSWVNSTVYFSQYTLYPNLRQLPLEILLNRTLPVSISFKIKSDYVQKPIPVKGFEGIFSLLRKADDGTFLYSIPYGGRMAEIPASATPFPHRAGNLYKVTSSASWQGDNPKDSDRVLRWSRRYHNYMTPYVSKSPRELYLNYRDLDIGVNNLRGKTSIAQARVWGRKYFKNNFRRLVRVKTAVDPDNFFRNEQSIPPQY